MKKAAAASKKYRSSRGDPRSSPWGWVLLGLMGLAVVGSLAYAIFLYQHPADTAAIEMTTAAAYSRYQTGADYFLDVRTPEEWAQAHLQNSSLIPLSDLSGRLSELPRDRNMVVVCATGSRSRQAQAILQKAGFAHAVSMKGGLTAWEAAGYPLVTGP
jgi:MYXO-CTERM domain-containing protein